MGMGMGFAMANQMGAAMSGGQNRPSQSQAAPPPIPPSLSFFIVLNGAQNGPHDISALMNMAQARSLTPDTLVWREGMGSWAPAKEVSELSGVFGSVPPPVPGA
ncbi:MAG: DUF4339 domain-containing protein [Candidatus Delongbacteria bacterium]|nr:DUF4339 domain-containing protein [Candidatus Delongbacteria bacterium]